MCTSFMGSRRDYAHLHFLHERENRQRASIITRASSRSSKTSCCGRHGALRPRGRRITRGAFHGNTWAARCRCLANALRFTPWTYSRETRPRTPQVCSATSLALSSRSSSQAILWRKRRIPSDFYPHPKLRPHGLARRHLRRSHWGRYRMDAFEES